MNRLSTVGSQGNGIILEDTRVVDTCPYTVVKTYRMYNTKSDPKVNGGLQAIKCIYIESAIVTNVLSVGGC